VSAGRRSLAVVAVVAAVAAVFVIKAQEEGPAAGVAAVVDKPLPRLVDLGSNQCIPCKKMAPILEQLATEYAGALVVEVIDVREDREAGARYGIRVIPTQIFYDAAGTERLRHEGFMSKEAILTAWQNLGVTLPGPRPVPADR
jgi:thioredoxin 1